MKLLKLTLFLCWCFSSVTLLASNQTNNFEIYNKHTDKVYYSISHALEEAARNTDFKYIAPGKWQASYIDTSKPTVIAISLKQKPDPNQKIDAYVMPPKKTLYLRVGLPAEKEKYIKETLKSVMGRGYLEADGYIFGPQTGPLLGLTRQGERHKDPETGQEFAYPLKNNIQAKDIKKITVMYHPAA